MQQTVSRIIVLTALAAFFSCFVHSPSHAREASLLDLDSGLAQRIEAAVVFINVEYTETHTGGIVEESGSGFFVNENTVLTNHHVIEAAVSNRSARLTVRSLSGTSNSMRYTVDTLRYDSDADLAVLRLPQVVEGVTPVQFDPSLPPKQTQLFAFGFPLGSMLDPSINGPNVGLRRGYVSRIIHDGKYIEADLNIDHGNSGGPVTDAFGYVRGVVRAMRGSIHNRDFACIMISTPEVLRFLDANGVRYTLRTGQVVLPGASRDDEQRLPEPATQPKAIPVPPANEMQRAFFSLGSQLRMATLVGKAMLNHGRQPGNALRKAAQANAQMLNASLERVAATDELRRRGQALTGLLEQETLPLERIANMAEELEKACDEWTFELEGSSKLNYDFGAWLLELSIGLISPQQDIATCERFMVAAERYQSAQFVQDLLQRIYSGLDVLKDDRTSNEKEAISKHADRLIGYGYLGTETGDSQTASPVKPGQTQSADSNGINRIRIPQF